MLRRKSKLPFGFLVSSIKEFENRLGRKLKDSFTKVLNKKQQTRQARNPATPRRREDREEIRSFKSGMEVRETEEHAVSGACLCWYPKENSDF